MFNNKKASHHSPEDSKVIIIRIFFNMFIFYLYKVTKDIEVIQITP